MNTFLEQIELLADEKDGIAALSNISAALKLHDSELNWAGFYIVRNDDLVLGPFQGKPACTHIPFANGVCGRCFSEKKAVLVEDVSQFRGHIACDSASRSELCVPVVISGRVYALIDLDSDQVSHFHEEDKKEMLGSPNVLGEFNFRGVLWGSAKKSLIFCFLKRKQHK